MVLKVTRFQSHKAPLGCGGKVDSNPESSASMHQDSRVLLEHHRIHAKKNWNGSKG